jgi:hypothetical protein
MSARRIFVLFALAVGLLGLGIDYWIIMTSAPVDVDGKPMDRGPIGQFIYFWSFFTHLTNLGLVLFYLAELTGWRWLAALRMPTWRASMAGMITLVMVFFHFMLAPNYHFTGGLLVANYLLHYVAPILFLIWWFALIPHGTLRYRDVPLMVVPGLIYVVLVLIRGAIVNDYPYAILNAAKAGYGGVAIGVGIILVSVGVFCLLLVFIDQLLGRRRAASA